MEISCRELDLGVSNLDTQLTLAIFLHFTVYFEKILKILILYFGSIKFKLKPCRNEISFSSQVHFYWFITLPVVIVYQNSSHRITSFSVWIKDGKETDKILTIFLFSILWIQFAEIRLQL